MKKTFFLAALAISLLCIVSCKTISFDPTQYVETMMGTGGEGGIVPMAAVPFGMVQLAPDTQPSGTGYYYGQDKIYGFSHTHKSGSGGGSDFEDILFTPVSGSRWDNPQELEFRRSTPFSHDDEVSTPGYYSVTLPEDGVKAELTATGRCGFHKYTYPEDKSQHLIINLKWGNVNNCTIIPEDQYDTVKVAYIEKESNYSVSGYRISNGWCPEMHVYFYAQFSKPISSFQLFKDCKAVDGTSLEGQDVRALLTFGGNPDEPLEVKVGISPVDSYGAWINMMNEIGGYNFARVHRKAHRAWVDQLSTLNVSNPDSKEGRTLYTCYYFSLLYPMLYSDVDGRFRSSDKEVYYTPCYRNDQKSKDDYNYYAGVLGLWDIFRAHLPLIAVVRPDVASDLMKTFLEHYRHEGQLPIWTLAGQETNCMEGYHSAPVIADFYSKGIRDFDAEAMLEALQVSSTRDTFGFFCRNYRGATNYLKYHYVPCDLEISACSKTLEYCYDDACISKFAKMLGHDDVAAEYAERASWYKNIFDPSVALMRGRMADGSWRTPFDPVYSNHNREGDDFMEGTAYHWTFHVQHDPQGLSELLGGPDKVIEKLDSLFFIIPPDIHGDNPSRDMTGMIGHYAQGNEPGHHIIYFYDIFGQPWRTQQLVTRVMHELYSTAPDGICGNDDTGQMSAWYVWNTLGLYPMTHGDARYMFGSPQMEKMSLKHPNGKLTIEAPGVSVENCYIKSISLNGQPYNRYWISHEDVFGGDACLQFEMTSNPEEAAKLTV